MYWRKDGTEFLRAICHAHLSSSAIEISYLGRGFEQTGPSARTMVSMSSFILPPPGFAAMGTDCA